MSVFGFFKKDMKFLVFFNTLIIMVLFLKYFLKKCDIIYFDIFSPMDNKKGKKGKYFFANIFIMIINDEPI
jgi:hypothetical protein